MITYVALPYQAYQLSGSSLVVGLLSLAELGPLLFTAFVGGALADAFDRRRLVQIAELGLAACAGVLVLQLSLGEPRLWVLFVVGAAMAAWTASSGRRSTRSRPDWSTGTSSWPRARSTPSAETSARWRAPRSPGC